jgi:Fic family protein
MAWNWEHPDWPDFQWDSAALAEMEARFLHSSGMQIGSLKHFDDETQLSIMVDTLTGEALKTSEIEGEILNRDSVQSSILNGFGLPTDGRRVAPAERGIADMMIDLHRHFDQPVTHATLHGWHRMITNGRTDLQDIGQYRTHEQPMQVVSGALHKPNVHFEAPPSAAMPGEMDRFIDWLAATAPGGERALPTLTRAGLAHLYFVCIHPFEDGNGRIARALAEKMLAQGIGQPTLLALSHTIQRHRKRYYDALEANNKDIEVTDWLVYFASTVLDAQRYTQRLIDFLIEKTKIYDRVRGQLNERQERVLARLFKEGPDGFKGGLSAGNYITITGAARATATRDLNHLVELNVLSVRGTLKSTRYWLNITGEDNNIPS